MNHKKYRLFKELNPIDQQLRKLKPVTGWNDNYTKLTIEMINGFEYFGHHETWSDGYRISDGIITVEAENLDEAINKFEVKQKELNND